MVPAYRVVSVYCNINLKRVREGKSSENKLPHKVHLFKYFIGGEPYEGKLSSTVLRAAMLTPTKFVDTLGTGKGESSLSGIN